MCDRQSVYNRVKLLDSIVWARIHCERVASKQRFEAGKKDRQRRTRDHLKRMFFHSVL